jgi:OOP family OmpA-OmpF porin
MRIIFTGFAALTLLTATAASAAEPKPQFSVQDLQKDFAKPQDETAVGKTRGFSLAAPAASTPSATPSASSAAPSSPAASKRASRPRPPGRQVATAQPPAPAASAPSGRDLLITFANASSTLTPQARSNAKVFAQAANTPQLRTARFAIDGHTNAVGNRDYNLTLSKARADALVDYLVQQGVERSRIEANGYGFDRPVDTHDPRSPANRRVEARRLQ